MKGDYNSSPSVPVAAPVLNSEQVVVRLRKMASVLMNAKPPEIPYDPELDRICRMVRAIDAYNRTVQNAAYRFMKLMDRIEGDGR